MAYQFRLPQIVELTAGQQAVVFEPDAFAVGGGPGTGKTVVSLWRHIQNWNQRGVKSLLLTYTKTLEFYLKNTASAQNRDAGMNVSRTYKWVYNPSYYDEIIVDEAQDVSVDKYHTIKSNCKIVCYGADSRQSLYDNGATNEQLEELFSDNASYELEQNFRNSKSILRFVQSLFPQFPIDLYSVSTEGQKPQLIVTDKSQDKLKRVLTDLLQNNDSTENLVILVPFQNMVTEYKKIVDSIVTGATFYMEEKGVESVDEIGNIHITTFKSSKGLEFDTVIRVFIN